MLPRTQAFHSSAGSQGLHHNRRSPPRLETHNTPQGQWQHQSDPRFNTASGGKPLPTPTCRRRPLPVVGVEGVVLPPASVLVQGGPEGGRPPADPLVEAELLHEGGVWTGGRMDGFVDGRGRRDGLGLARPGRSSGAESPTATGLERRGLKVGRVGLQVAEGGRGGRAGELPARVPPTQPRGRRPFSDLHLLPRPPSPGRSLRLRLGLLPQPRQEGLGVSSQRRLLLPLRLRLALPRRGLAGVGLRVERRPPGEGEGRGARGGRRRRLLRVVDKDSSGRVDGQRHLLEAAPPHPPPRPRPGSHHWAAPTMAPARAAAHLW